MQQSSASSNNNLPFGPKTLVLGATAMIAYGLVQWISALTRRDAELSSAPTCSMRFRAAR